MLLGATRAEQLLEIRKIVPKHFLLIPGVEKQGGNFEDVAKYAMNSDCGLLVNSSRGIIYAGNGHDFAMKAREQAENYNKKMACYICKIENLESNFIYNISN